MTICSPPRLLDKVDRGADFLIDWELGACNLLVLQPSVTIDSLWGETQALKEAVLGAGPMRPSAVRSIWRTRLRPFWRQEPRLYEGIASRLAALGENFLVIEVAAESRLFFGDLPKMVYLETLALARAGSPQRCLDILLERREVLAGVTDAPALRGRICKDGWKATGDARLLAESLDHYLLAYRESGGDPFPGVNAASVALIAGRNEEARALAAEVRSRLGNACAGEGYWAAVTRAECALVLGEVEIARGEYRKACAGGDVPRANLVTTRSQARLLLPHHGCGERDFDDVFALPNVACFTGHKTDDIARPAPRFPASNVPAVAARLREVLSARQIRLGFSSAARGGDIVFAEAIRDLPDGETNIFIPGDRENFRRASVTTGVDPSWDLRFEQTLADADEVTEIEPCRGDGLQPVDFDYCNRLCLGAAMFRAQELDSELTLIALWDGLPGPLGGTSDAVRLARKAGLNVEVIHPSEDGPVHLSPAVEEEAPREEGHLFSILAIHLHSDTIPSVFQKAVCLQWDKPIVTAVFSSTHDAIAAAETLLDEGCKGEMRVALHFAPLEFLKDPTGKNSAYPGGVHMKRARELHSLSLPESVCASAEFAAAARLEGSDAAFEYLGQLNPEAGVPDRRVFRVVPRARAR